MMKEFKPIHIVKEIPVNDISDISLQDFLSHLFSKDENVVVGKDYAITIPKNVATHSEMEFWQLAKFHPTLIFSMPIV